MNVYNYIIYSAKMHQYFGKFPCFFAKKRRRALYPTAKDVQIYFFTGISSGMYRPPCTERAMNSW